MQGNFEQGPIRPPSEAKSLLIRLTRGCPWNKCAFCSTYRNTKFSIRTVEEVKDDIRTAAAAAEKIRAFSQDCGEGGQVTDRLLHALWGHWTEDGVLSSVAAWMYYGGESVFLQDADSLVMKTDDVVDILSCLREHFPSVTRVTSYSRSRTASHKSVEDFHRLREAGLTRIHMGMESGCDSVLEFVRKGVTARQHVEGGRRIREAGISLSEYFMPGLGGVRWSREHAEHTARTLNLINPDFIRLRTLHVKAGSDLDGMMQAGDFKPIGDEDILREIRVFIEHLEGIASKIVSDHILNLLEELEGRLPEDKPRLLETIDGFFRLPERDRLIFRVGRRSGNVRNLSDLSDRDLYLRIGAFVDGYAKKGQDCLERDLGRAMRGYI